MIWLLMFIFVMPLGITAQAEENQESEEKTWEVGIGVGRHPIYFDGRKFPYFFYSEFPLTLNLGLKYTLPKTLWRAGFGIDYWQGEEGEKYWADYEKSVIVIMLDVERIIPFSKSISGFLGIGGGLYQVNYKSEYITDSGASFTHTSTFNPMPGMVFKGGIDCALFWGFGAGLEIRYHLAPEKFLVHYRYVENGKVISDQISEYRTILSGINPFISIKYRF